MKKLFTIILSVVFLSAIACACAAGNDLPDASSAAPSSAPEAQEPEVAPSVPATATPGAETEEIKYIDDTIRFTYYDVALEKDVEAAYPIDRENAGPEAALEAVNKEFLAGIAGGQQVKANSVLFSDGNLFIDFTSDIYGLDIGSAGEKTLLDSIADAYLNNVENIKAVFFSVDGAGYTSENIEIPKDESYKEK